MRVRCGAEPPPSKAMKPAAVIAAAADYDVLPRRWTGVSAFGQLLHSP
jgi:hypothetical protein